MHYFVLELLHHAHFDEAWPLFLFQTLKKEQARAALITSTDINRR